MRAHKSMYAYHTVSEHTFISDQLDQSIPFYGLLSGNFQYYSNLNRIFWKKAAETLIRRRFPWRLIRVVHCLPTPLKKTPDRL